MGGVQPKEDEAIRNPLGHRWGIANAKTGEKRERKTGKHRRDRKRKESEGARLTGANHEARRRPSQLRRRDHESIRSNQSINRGAAQDSSTPGVDLTNQSVLTS